MKTISHSTRFTLEAQLVEAARLGDTSSLVEYIYTDLLRPPAAKLVRMFGETGVVGLDIDDVVQTGAEYILYRLDKALNALNPVAFLVHAARFAMLHYCQEQRSLIRVSCVQQWRGVTVPQVESLDAPLNRCEDLTLLDLLAGVA